MLSASYINKYVLSKERSVCTCSSSKSQFHHYTTEISHSVATLDSFYMYRNTYSSLHPVYQGTVESPSSRQAKTREGQMILSLTGVGGGSPPPSTPPPSSV